MNLFRMIRRLGCLAEKHSELPSQVTPNGALSPDHIVLGCAYCGARLDRYKNAIIDHDGNPIKR